jgi:transaldolase
MTVAVADTGDINSIQKFKPRDATTNPSLLATAAGMPVYADIVDSTLGWSKKAKGGTEVTDVVKRAIDRMSVEFGL